MTAGLRNSFAGTASNRRRLQLLELEGRTHRGRAVRRTAPLVSLRTLPFAIASFVLLPLVIIDIVRLSNRFTGPLLRMRRSMRALAQGEQVEPLKFRDADFWHDP